MDINVEYRPVNSLAQIRLQQGEEVVVEPGAMVGMTTNLQMDTGMASNDDGGGMLSKIGNAASRMLTGESFFQNTYRAEGGPGEILLSHTLTGDIVTMDVPETGLMVQSSSYIASGPAVQLDAKLGGFKSFFAGEGLFLIEVTTRQPGAPLLVGAFGGIEPMQVDGSLVIDSGHLVAWDADLQYQTEKAGGGFISSILSGEGYVCHFQGQGRVWLQTRNPNDFGNKIGRMLPSKES